MRFFVRYLEARIGKFNRDETFRSYVARSLQLIPQNKNIVPTYEEILKPQLVDTRSGDEIAHDMIVKAGLKFGD